MGLDSHRDQGAGEGREEGRDHRQEGLLDSRKGGSVNSLKKTFNDKATVVHAAVVFILPCSLALCLASGDLALASDKTVVTTKHTYTGTPKNRIKVGFKKDEVRKALFAMPDDIQIDPDGKRTERYYTETKAGLIHREDALKIEYDQNGLVSDVTSEAPPSDLIKKFRKATESLIKQNYNEVIPLCNEIISSRPSFIAAQRVRAFAYSATNDYPNAESDYNNVMTIEPNDIGAITGLAAIKAHNKQYEAALEFWDKAVSIEPDNMSHLYYRGLAKLQKGDFKEGLVDIDDASKKGFEVPQNKQMIDAVRKKVK